MDKRHPVHFVGAGPGDPELITLRGRRLLDEADMIIYTGSLVNPALLDGLDADLYDSAGLNLDQIIDLMARGHTAGKRVVRLHSGDPSIYGAIREQMRRLDAMGIPYSVVPGVTSATAAAAALKTELTVPELTQTVIFTRRSGRTPVPEREGLENLATARASMCIFLSVSRIDEVAEELIRGGYPADTPVAVVEKASWPEERIIRSTLDAISARVRKTGIRKTAMILVGQAISDDPFSASRLYDAGFSHGCRE